MQRYYLLELESGAALSDAGVPVAWAACPALPGAYEEAPTPAEAREQLRRLARWIVAEHLMRDDPLDPDIVMSDGPQPARDDLLVLTVSDADIEEARRAPLLTIEAPEP